MFAVCDNSADFCLEVHLELRAAPSIGFNIKMRRCNTNNVPVALSCTYRTLRAIPDCFDLRIQCDEYYMATFL